MSAPNLELVPLDRRAGQALIAGSVQVGRCVVPMRFIQPGSRRVAGADGAHRTGRTGRLWALGRRAPSLESPVVPSNGRAARVDIGTPPPLHCTAGGPSGAAWPCGSATCAAAAAQLAVGHGARRRAQLRPAPSCPCASPFSGSLRCHSAHAPARPPVTRHCFCIDMRSLCL